MTEPQRLDLDKVILDLQYHLEASKFLLSRLEKARLSQLMHNSVERAKKQLEEAHHTVNLVEQAINSNPLSERFPIIERDV